VCSSDLIVLILKGANYIRTVRGQKGGIALAKDPSKVTLGEIIRLIEGTTSPINCVSATCHEKCNFENRCSFKEVFAEVKKKINDVVDKTTLADMVERTQSMKKDKHVIDFNI
jgi:Rrf2 family transcriptional regulator, cysteine metabolism repressor